MKKWLFFVPIAAILFLSPCKSFAWGKKGHELVAEIANHFLDSAVRETVKKYLGGYSFGEAANWMDDSRSNSYFDYMKPWHYLDMEKGEQYKPAPERNILTVLFSAINELKNQNGLKKKEIKRDILLIFHLIGDLHQPLHTGYASDKGGNTIEIKSQNFASNLHSAWDTQILETESVSYETCMNLYDSMTIAQVDSARKINVLQWYYQSRSYMDTVYNFKNFYLDQQYINTSVTIIKKQLLLGGIRLASVINTLFRSPASLASGISLLHFMESNFPACLPFRGYSCCHEG
jgi:S1/P1 Nuclease